MKKSVKTLAMAACIGMFLILMMGVTVSQTESGRGCGDDWPLCRGKFVPAYTVESMIEYSHRAVTGVVGLVILASTIATFAYVKRKDARFYAGGALLFTIVQALLGAAQVKNPQSDEILALHFGISLIAFTFTFMLVVAIRQAERGAAGRKASAIPVPKWFQTAVWLTAIYAYLVVYSGAYVAHTESGGGCFGFPLCNNTLVPALEGATAIAFAHRMAAYALFFIVLVLAFIARSKFASNRLIRNGANLAFAFVTGQIASGALLMALMGTEWYVFGTLLHTILVSLLFAVLVYLGISTRAAGRGSYDS
ncbi:COX15/CtaA family protein [Paenibacillus thermotolerans]|uniref:COX15/CtaA family protein n=1 Tax=Paenibacillus thermotolerans TaxID=3027807 RepID=UPI00236821CE|nr:MULTISPECIES: COX15/CtaA family protein [unclassified Paenibacillus]